MRSFKYLVFLWSIATAGILQAGGVDLRGTVADENGAPAPNVVVYIAEGAPRKGTSGLRGSSHPDRGKLATTDKDGAFTIAGLDDQTLYKIVLAAEEHPAVVMNKADPTKEMKGKLKPIAKDRAESGHHLRGRVSDAKGPVVGAEVSPFGIRKGEQRWWGSTPGVDQLAVTNAKGEFLLTSKDPEVAVDIRVSGKNVASVNYALLQFGEQVHELSVTPGATVKGKLVSEGQPVAGVAIGAVQKNRGTENFTGVHETVTDEQGLFVLEHLKPNDDYEIFSKMQSLGERGAMPKQSARTEGDGGMTELTEAELQPVYTVAGRVRLSDEKPVPSGSRLYLGRDEAWDSQTVTLDKEGKFTFKGVPAEVIDLSLRIKGYHLSDQNVSFDAINPSMMMGAVDGDITDLDILMEPGETDYNNRARGDHARLKSTRLEGIPAGGAAATGQP